jgi:hypothetical protein
MNVSGQIHALAGSLPFSTEWIGDCMDRGIGLDISDKKYICSPCLESKYDSSVILFVT